MATILGGVCVSTTVWAQSDTPASPVPAVTDRQLQPEEIEQEVQQKQRELRRVEEDLENSIQTTRSVQAVRDQIDQTLAAVRSASIATGLPPDIPRLAAELRSFEQITPENFIQVRKIFLALFDQQVADVIRSLENAVRPMQFINPAGLDRRLAGLQQQINDRVSETMRIYRPWSPGIAVLLNQSFSALSGPDATSVLQEIQEYADKAQQSLLGDLGILKEDLIRILEAALQSVDAELAEAARERADLDERAATIAQAISRLQRQQGDYLRAQSIANADLVKWTLVIWILAIIVAIVALFVLTKMQQSGDSPQKNQGFLLEIVSLFVVTAAILILGLAEKLSEQSLAALLGGVAGYLFGRTRQTEPSASTNSSASNREA